MRGIDLVSIVATIACVAHSAGAFVVAPRAAGLSRAGPSGSNTGSSSTPSLLSPAATFCRGSRRGLLPRRRGALTTVCASGDDSGEAAARPGFASKIPNWEEIRSRMPLNKRREVPRAAVVFTRDEAGSCHMCQAVWLALLETGIQFREVLAGEECGGDFPCIEEEESEGDLAPPKEARVCGWMDCLMHMEEKYPQVPLLPSDEGQKARAMELIDNANDVVLAPDFLLSVTGSTSKMLEGRDALLQAMTSLESLLEEAREGSGGGAGEEGGDFLLGSAFSLVDCVYLPIVERHAALLPALHPGFSIVGNTTSLPLVNAWLTAASTRVPGYAGRAGGDAVTHLAELAEVDEAFGLALQDAIVSDDWRLALKEDVPPSWINYNRRYPTSGKTPKIEGAWSILEARGRLAAKIAGGVQEVSNGQGRMRPSSVDLDGSVPDLSLRLLATVMVEGPDYASAPNFATAFVGTLLDGWSADQLTELANSYLFLRRSIKVPGDVGILPGRQLRAHTSWLGREAAKAAKAGENQAKVS